MYPDVTTVDFSKRKDVSNMSRNNTAVHVCVNNIGMVIFSFDFEPKSQLEHTHANRKQVTKKVDKVLRKNKLAR